MNTPPGSSCCENANGVVTPPAGCPASVRLTTVSCPSVEAPALFTRIVLRLLAVSSASSGISSSRDVLARLVFISDSVVWSSLILIAPVEEGFLSFIVFGPESLSSPDEDRTDSSDILDVVCFGEDGSVVSLGPWIIVGFPSLIAVASPPMDFIGDPAVCPILGLGMIFAAVRGILDVSRFDMRETCSAASVAAGACCSCTEAGGLASTVVGTFSKFSGIAGFAVIDRVGFAVIGDRAGFTAIG